MTLIRATLSRMAVNQMENHGLFTALLIHSLDTVLMSVTIYIQFCWVSLFMYWSTESLIEYTLLLSVVALKVILLNVVAPYKRQLILQIMHNLLRNINFLFNDHPFI